MVNRYRPAGDGIMRPVPAKSHLCATYVDAHDYAALEARCRELEEGSNVALLCYLRLRVKDLEADKRKWFLLSSQTAAAARIAELEAALRDVQNDGGNWLASALQGRIAALVGPGGTSPAGYPSETAGKS